MCGFPGVVTRFAPSPTGRLHLGHAYAAFVAHQFACQAGGKFLLRFEDIDATRVRPEFYTEIEDDLGWLGLQWERPAVCQLDRLPAYETALERLKSMGVVYPCFCSRKDIQDEIARMASAPQGPEGPLYPGTCRSLPAEEARRRIREGEVPAWRLHAAKAGALAGPLRFEDLGLGVFDVDPCLLGDVILARKDIGTSYHLAVVVDDAGQQVSHVTRGEDLLPSTHVHRLLQTLLDFPQPCYLHHALVLDENGRRLAKRDAARSLAELRGEGLTPAQVRALLPPMPADLAD